MASTYWQMVSEKRREFEQKLHARFPQEPYENCEDAVSTAIIAVSKQAHVDDVTNYLFQSSVYALYRMHRRDRPRIALTFPSTSLEHRIEAKDSLRYYAKCIGPTAWECMVRALVDGISELAQREGVQVGTVKHHLWVVRRRLREVHDA